MARARPCAGGNVDKSEISPRVCLWLPRSPGPASSGGHCAHGSARYVGLHHHCGNLLSRHCGVLPGGQILKVTDMCLAQLKRAEFGFFGNRSHALGCGVNGTIYQGGVCVSTVSTVCAIKAPVPVRAEDGLGPLHLHFADAADDADDVTELLTCERNPDCPHSQPPQFQSRVCGGSSVPGAVGQRVRGDSSASQVGRRRSALLPVAQGVIGLSQRKRRNRAKSPSVEQSVSPCSTASAAR